MHSGMCLKFGNIILLWYNKHAHVLVKRSKMACPSLLAPRLICAHALAASLRAFFSFFSNSRSLKDKTKGGRGDDKQRTEKRKMSDAA